MLNFLPLHDRLILEIDQRLEEGYPLDADAWKRRIARCNEENADELEFLMHELAEVSLPDRFHEDEPVALPDILASVRPYTDVEVPESLFPVSLLGNERNLYNSFHGALLGRACGCSLGRPFCLPPFTVHPEKRQRHEIERWFKGADAWPIAGYAPADSRASVRGLSLTALDSTRKNIKAMEPDPVFDSWVLGMEKLNKFGLDFGSRHLFPLWGDSLPFGHFPLSDRQAFLNTLHNPGISIFQESGLNEEEVDWEFLAGGLNPWREDTHARNRAELFGLICPGLPAKAAELAWRDARATHTRSGIYAAMFSAALVSAAFTESDPVKLVKIAFGNIPGASRLAHGIAWVLEAHAQFLDWVDCWDAMQIHFPSRPFHHAIPNTMICVIALLYGGRDFGKALGIAVSGGYYPAANGATVGTISGIQTGAREIPPSWAAPLGNTLKTNVLCMERLTLTDVSSRVLEIARAAWNQYK